jgi:capsule polysaccharide export protein KpsE/RkpR
MLRCCIIGLALAALIAFLVPSRYVSTARLAPPATPLSHGMLPATITAGATSALGLSAGSGLSQLLGGSTPSDQLVGILETNSVMDGVIRECDLKHVYGHWRIEDLRKKLSASSDISNDSTTGIVTVSVTDHGPERAAQIAQAYIDQLQRAVTRMGAASARSERIFLEKRLAGVGTDLEASEQEFSQFASQRSAMNVPFQGAAAVESISSLQAQLTASEVELAQLRKVYTDKAGDVQLLQARVKSLRAAIADALKGGHASGAGDSPQQSPSMGELPILGVRYADLLRRVTVQEKVFEMLTLEYESARVEEARDTLSVNVMDVPLVPQKRSFPPRGIITLFGGFLGLTWGATWVLFVFGWRAIPDNDPRRLLAAVVAADLRGRRRNK